MKIILMIREKISLMNHHASLAHGEFNLILKRLLNDIEYDTIRHTGGIIQVRSILL